MKNMSKQFHNTFCKKLVDSGFRFVTGVPCGVLKYIISNFVKNPKVKHIFATRESEAVGIAAGATLSGKKQLFICKIRG